MKRFCTFFVILITLSCWISVADAQKPTIDILIEQGTPANPTVGETMGYRIGIQDAQNVIGFSLTYAYPKDICRLKSVGSFGERESGTHNSQTHTLESSTRLVDSRFRNIIILDLVAVSAGTGKIRVTGTLHMLPGHGPSVNVDVSLPIRIAPLPESLPQQKSTEVVSIPDANLAAAVRKTLGLAPNAPITKQAMQKLTELEARNSQIKNLTGLEHATQLTDLRLDLNQIRDVSPLRGLTQLRFLSLEINQISDIRPLSGLTQLEALYIGRNQISGVEVLTKFKQLKLLSLYSNTIRNITPLANLKKLEVLLLENNQIRDVSPLAGLVNLEVLSLKENPIQDTSPLATLTNLRSVDIEMSPSPAELVPIEAADTEISIPDRNLAAAVRRKLGLAPRAPITDRAMQKLTGLDAKESRIKNLTGLEHATQLIFLELRKNQIRDIRPLANLKNLKELILEVNDVRDISPLANLTQLTLLYIAANPISDFTPLANLTQLRKFALWGNNISDVTLLADKVHLTHLHLWNNNISDISPLANLTQLQVLHLERNQIRDVSPLAGLTNLTELTLRGNPIADKSPLRILKKRNPKLKLDIEIPPPSPVVHIKATQRPPMYWIDSTVGTLHRLVDTEVENLVPTVKNATSLAIDVARDKLYWTEKTGKRRGRIRGANLDGTNVQLVKDLTSVPLDIALDAASGKIYLTNAWGKVQRMNVDGSNFQPNLITNLDAPRGLALDVAGGKVYWAETTEASGRIRRANLDGSNVQNVATGLVPSLSLAVANGKIYWTEGTTENAGKLHRAHLDGTNSEMLETLSLAPTGIAVDTGRNSLYLTARSGEIHRRDLDGSGDEPVVTGLVAPSNIVLGITATTPDPTDPTETPATPVVDAATDVNQDQKVNKTDLLLVVTALGENPPANPNFDVNADGAVNIADVLLVIEDLDDPVAAAAPSLGGTMVSFDPAFLTAQIDLLRAESDGSLKYAHAIAFFQGLLASIRPTEPQLLANYPNPFNPETWIPYQLAAPTDVTVTIYAVDGRVVRTLALGHQPIGIYQDKSRAAYWNGRNDVGEPVASGVYFYTLKAGDFTATRKMLIRK